jgi:type II secretory ATPase GspE/PulE/Tfp pilus assembly ATPase PilB-like protein
MQNTQFEWPTPLFFEFLSLNDSDKTATESCLVYLRNGDKLLGELLEFQPDSSSIVFQSSRSDAKEAIRFEDIKSMRLIRSMQIRKQKTELETRAEEIFDASERQPYHIEFHDKEVQEGETLGFYNTAHGIYLFTPTADERIVRQFIPHQAIAHCKMGLRIGEMLIDEHLASPQIVGEALSNQKELRNKRIGDYLSEHKIISSEQLNAAIKMQENQPILRLGEALQQLGLIDQNQLDMALEEQKKNRNLQLGQILLQMKVIDEQTLKGALAKKLGIPYVSLEKFNFDPVAIALMDRGMAHRHGVVPLCLHNDTLIVALENPLNRKVLDYLRFSLQRKIDPAMAAREEIFAAIDRIYPNKTEALAFDVQFSKKGRDEYSFHHDPSEGIDAGELTEKLFDEGIELEMPEKPVAESDNTLVQFVNTMIMDAHKDGVSDIHIETYSGKQNTRIRFRKDGTLVPYMEIPSSARDAMISRIKIMAQLDISERRKPQDGKINFQLFGPSKLELRVATIPTSNGMEDIVMRLLASNKPLSMEKLGMASNTLHDLQKVMQRPYGLILVCGPTGSGKTTTLHSLLGYINSPGRKIWTAEDPVEITQPGLRQVQVNAKIGWTFATAMRSFLRADPDVIMVGEMRDQETTKIAIEASLTGHLVLSTLHTNSAAESIVRLLDMGMDPFNFADALQAILAQRLTKALCPECKEVYEPEPAEIDALAEEYVSGTQLDAAAVLQDWRFRFASDKRFNLYRARGCKACADTGYRGRMALHELLQVTPTIKHLIQTRAPVSEILNAAQTFGMRTIKQDGILKVLDGLTDIVQVRSVSL